MPSTYRLFIAIELPEPVKNALAGLRAEIPDATWVKPHAYHLTLRFLGDSIDQAGLSRIQTALSAVRAEPFEFWLSGVGRFPISPKTWARVLWVGVQAPPALGDLQRMVERAVTGCGWPPDQQKFHAHITLARLRSARGQAQIAAFLAGNRSFRAGPVAAESFHLIASTLSPQGPTYAIQSSYPLVKH